MTNDKGVSTNASGASKVKARVELGEVTVHNIRQLKKLNSVVFPVSYNDKFYKDVLLAGELARLAYYNDVVVGAVCCRVDIIEGKRHLYIMTLGCLAPYRRLGIGTIMLEHVLNYVENDGNFESIFLHVQVNNADAINFYQKFGFCVKETKPAYYKRIEPAEAHVLSKALTKNALNDNKDPSSSSAAAVKSTHHNHNSINQSHTQNHNNIPNGKHK